MTRTTGLSLIAMAASLFHFAPARADIGTDTAKLLQLMYQDTRKDCGDVSKPAHLCSGVLLRATSPSTAYRFYSLSPASITRGGVSASYLRKDAKFQNLAFGMTSGFVFDNVLVNPQDHVDHRILCSFPVDGATDRRTTLAGCGDYVLNGNSGDVVETYCDQMGITTAEQWVKRYFDPQGVSKTAPGVGKICAFNSSASNPRAAEAFYQDIVSQGLLATTKQKFNNSNFQENEVVLAPWKIDVPRSPSILASFYVGQAGVAGARISQIQWYQDTKQVLPAISITLPVTAQQDAIFLYEGGKQAILPITEPDSCSQYVQSARWVNRYDPGFKKNINSLEVTPTECGRRTQSNQTNNFFNELVSRYYLNPEWVNNPDNPIDNTTGMRRQLVCVMTIARSKASWFLEPSRPYTTHQKAVAAGCNNTSA